tara:strand:+ start:965 stop:3127 length:2163 start_codon:yes stop_codon:yes gene_type:complete
MVEIDPSTRKILDKYGSKLGDQFQSAMDQPSKEVFTKDYDTFRKEATGLQNTLYEKASMFAASIINLEPSDKEKAQKVQDAIEVIQLNVTPASSYSLAILTMAGFVLLGFLLGFITFLLGNTQILLSAFLIFAGVGLLFPLTNYPIHLAQKHRLQASNQMVLCILYIVIYMRHTSNLEHAIKFAGEHVGNPLALDLRKIYWDVETKRFSNITDSIEHYLVQWKDHNLQFVESMHLIESSLFEANEKRRIQLLEKSLEIILEGTYESMLHYAQNVKSPITMLHMLGVILPILGLIVLPLLGGMMGVNWFHVFLLYNLALPVIVFYVGYSILAKRPVGYAQTDIAESHESYKKMQMLSFKTGKDSEMLIDPKHVAIFMIFLFFIIGFSPFILHAMDPAAEMQLGESMKLLDYRTTETGIEVGPFGIGAVMLSLLLPLGLGLGLGFYYKTRSKKLIKIRNETQKLETEFRGAIFQLGNRIGGGMPAEMAFGKVSQSLGQTPTGKFLGIVDKNIKGMGMNLEDAIFNEKNGALISFPSPLIESTMKVLVESSKKGPKIVSKALVSIAEYLDRINKVTERLKDLLAEISSSMKSQVAFLTPLIAGIVVGIGTMITTIIGSLATQLTAATEGGGDVAGLGGGGLMDLFPLESLMPPFFLQMVVGIYVVQMVYVLTVLANGIENGVDKLKEEDSLGKNLYRSSILYVMIAAITIFAFNLLAAAVGKM